MFGVESLRLACEGVFGQRAGTASQVLDSGGRSLLFSVVRFEERSH